MKRGKRLYRGNADNVNFDIISIFQPHNNHVVHMGFNDVYFSPCFRLSPGDPSSNVGRLCPSIAYPFVCSRPQRVNIIYLPAANSFYSGARNEFVQVGIYTASKNRYRYHWPDKLIWYHIIECPLPIRDSLNTTVEIYIDPPLYLQSGRLYYLAIQPGPTRNISYSPIYFGINNADCCLGDGLPAPPALFTKNNRYPPHLFGIYSTMNTNGTMIPLFRYVREKHFELITLDANNNYYGEIYINTVSGSPKHVKVSIPPEAAGRFVTWTALASNNQSPTVVCYGPGLLSVNFFGGFTACYNNNCGYNHYDGHHLWTWNSDFGGNYYFNINTIYSDNYYFRILRIGPHTPIELSGEPLYGNVTGGLNNWRAMNYYSLYIPQNNGGVYDIWTESMNNESRSTAINLYHNGKHIINSRICQYPCPGQSFNHPSTRNHSRMRLLLNSNTQYIITVTSHDGTGWGNNNFYRLHVRRFTGNFMNFNYNNGYAEASGTIVNPTDEHWYQLTINESHPYHFWTQLGTIPATVIFLGNPNTGEVLFITGTCNRNGCNLNHHNNHARYDIYLNPGNYWLCVSGLRFNNVTGSYTVKSKQLTANNIVLSGNPLYGEANGNISPAGLEQYFIVEIPNNAGGLYDVWTQALTYNNNNMWVYVYDNTTRLYGSYGCSVPNCNLDHANWHYRLGDNMTVGILLDGGKKYLLEVVGHGTGTYKLKIQKATRRYPLL